MKNLFLSQPFTSDAETVTILSQITYLIKNKQVKKVSYRKYFYKTIGQWLIKKLFWYFVQEIVLFGVQQSPIYHQLLNLLVAKFGAKVAVVIVLLLI